MSSTAIEMTKAYFDSIDLRYRVADRDNVLTLGFRDVRNIGSFEIILIFSDDRYVSLKVYNICKVPEDKKDCMYKVCSDLNNQYRWDKFYLDEDDNTITMQSDAIIEPESAGEKIARLIRFSTGVAGEAYPALMKALWA